MGILQTSAFLLSGSPEDHPALFASTPVDSPDSSIDTPLNTTGDITVEEVKDYLT